MPSDSLENLPSADALVTKSQAYRAMLLMLEYYFRVGSEYPVASILGDLSPGAWADDSPGDPAAWSMWLNAPRWKSA